MLIEMDGEQGTQIRDETQTHTAISDYNNRHHFKVTLYEDSINELRIQLDCTKQYLGDLLGYDCHLAHHVNVWIDLNDDEKFDEVVSRVHQRSPISNELSRDTYDLQIAIPLIDEWNTKAGMHRMRLRLTPSEIYSKKCGQSAYSETREYIVNIVPRTRIAGKIYPIIDYRDLGQTYILRKNLHLLWTFCETGVLREYFQTSI
jgi:hypothetical protein